MNRIASRLFAGLCVLALLSSCGTSGKIRNSALPSGSVTTTGLVATNDGFSFPNFTAAATPEQFNAADVVSMFGSSSSVCRDGKANPCELVAQAAGWARLVNQARQSGHCEGFAALAAARFAQKATPSTATLKNTGDVTHAIMRSFATQFEQTVQKETSSWAKKSLSEKLDALKTSIATGKEEYSLGVYSSEGGHAVLPYAVNALPNNQFKVMVYDSNWPGAQRWVLVDLKKKTWSFSYSGSDPNNDPKMWTGKSSDLDLTSMTSRSTGKCPFCGGKVGIDTSLFVIRSAALNWSVTTSNGTLSPVQRDAGSDSARPLKASDGASGLNDYVISVAANQKITMSLPAESHVTGVTPSASIETQTTGDGTAAISITDSSVSSSSSSAVVTLAAGDLVATANGTSTTIDASTPDKLAVHVETASGAPIDVAVTPSAPAVEIRTAGNPNLGSSLDSQVLVQNNSGTVSIKSVDTSGVVSNSVQTSPLANTQTTVSLPATLSGATTLTALPPAAERTFTPDTTTSSTTSSTVPITTTTVKPVVKSTTTTSSTVPATTSSTVPPTTTTSTIPLATPWSQTSYAPGGNGFRDINTDSAGNTYSIYGFCGSPLNLGSSSVQGNANNGVCTIGVVKYSPTGSILWSTPITGDASQNWGESIAIDSSQNVYITGFFSGSHVTSGAITVNSTGAGYNSFIMKFNSLGVAQWGRVLGGASTQNLAYDWMIDLVASGSNIYVVGQINGNGNVITFAGASVTSSSSYDMFVTRINPDDGTSSWAHAYPVRPNAVSQETTFRNRATVDSSGNVYVSGTYTASSISIGGTTLTNTLAGKKDIYVIKVDSSGTTQWAVSAGSSGDDDVSALESTPNGIYLAGDLAASATVGGVSLAVGSGGAAFIAKISPQGSFMNPYIAVNSFQFSTGNSSVESDSSGVYVSGSFSGSFTLSGSTYTASGYDVYLIKYSLTGSVQWVRVLGNSGDSYSAFLVPVPGGVVLGFDNSNSAALTVGSTTFNGKQAFLVVYDRDGATI
jgi:hypothetical protein